MSGVVPCWQTEPDERPVTSATNDAPSLIELTQTPIRTAEGPFEVTKNPDQSHFEESNSSCAFKMGSHLSER